MKAIKALTDNELSNEYVKCCKLWDKFSNDKKKNVINTISEKVSKDSKVKYVQKNFSKAKELRYGKIFGGYNTASEFFSKIFQNNLTSKIKNEDFIYGKSVEEYKKRKFTEKLFEGCFFVWLIGKEICQRAKIAADGIKKNKKADKNFSPTWSFILSTKMNDVAKAMASEDTTAKLAIDPAAKAAKVSATKQNNYKLSSTSGNKSKVMPKVASDQNSFNVAKGTSDKKNKFSLKKSLSGLLFNKSEKSKGDTSEPNQKGFKKLKKLWKSKNSKISPLKISVNDTNYTFNNFEELKKTVINILNKCDELYSKECTNALNEFEGLVTRLKTSYPELRAPSRDTEPVHPALKKYSDIILKAKEGPLYGLNDYIHSKDGSAKSGGFEGALAAVKLMTWDGNNMNKNRLAWKIFNGKNFKYTKKFKFDEEIMKELEKRYEEAGKQYSAYSSDVTALVQYLIQFSGVTETLDEFTLSRIKQLSWYKSQLLVLEKELKISQRKSSMLGVRKNNRQREELKDKADDKRESEKKNIKNENLNQTKKSFSKESRSKIEELMKKSDDGSLQENDRKTLLDLLEHKELSGETLTKKEKTELDNLLHAKGLKTKEEVEALSDNEFLDYLME